MINDHGPSNISNTAISEMLIDIVDKRYKQHKSVVYKNILWCMKRVMQKVGVVNYFPVFNPNIFTFSQVDRSPIKQSQFAINLLFADVRNIEKIIKKRLEVKNQISNFLRIVFCKKNISICEELSVGYYLVLNFSNEFLLANTYKCLINAGLPVLRWPDLPQEILAESLLNKNSISFFRSHLFIPTHQSMNKRGLDKAFKKILEAELVGWTLHKIDKDQWNFYADKFNSPIPLTQAWAYGEIKSQISEAQVQRLAFYNSQKEVVGLVQLSRKNIISNILGLVRVNRGPIIISNNNESFDANHSLMSLALLCSKRFGYLFRVLSLAPPLGVDSSLKAYFKLNRLHRVPTQGYITGFLNLQKSEDHLFNNLNSKWRNLLRKALKSNLKIIVHNIYNELICI